MGLRSKLLGVVLHDLPTTGSSISIGDARFDELMGGKLGPGRWGRFESPPDAPGKYGSNCGVTVAGWLIDAGAPPELINANPPGGSGFKIGEHLTRTMQGAKALGWWHPPGNTLPDFHPGDVYFMDHPGGGHTGVVTDVGQGTFGTADGGQGNSRIARRTRTLMMSGGHPMVDGAAFLGWVAIGGDAPDDALELPGPRMPVTGTGGAPPAPPEAPPVFKKPLWPAFLVAAGAGIFIYGMLSVKPRRRY